MVVDEQSSKWLYLQANGHKFQFWLPGIILVLFDRHGYPSRMITDTIDNGERVSDEIGADKVFPPLLFDNSFYDRPAMKQFMERLDIVHEMTGLSRSYLDLNRQLESYRQAMNEGTV